MNLNSHTMTVCNTNRGWALFEGALEDLCVAWRAGKFVPVLEADIAGYLYFAILNRTNGDASCWHLDTRLHRAKANDKFDLVYGPVLSADAQCETVRTTFGVRLTSEQAKLIDSPYFRERLRPAVDGHLVIELKLFATGFTAQQQAEHFRQALNDIQRLETLREPYPECRGALFVDPDGYIAESRGARLRDARTVPSSTLRLYVCRRISEGAIWERLGG
jgi:hypothetical protein